MSDERDPDPEGDAPPLYLRTVVWIAVTLIAIVIAFGGAIDGALVWDDATMIGAAARLPSPWAAFSRDFFGLGAAAQAGAGASWFRPLTTLSFALDLKVFSAAPQFGLHLVNLLWHTLAAALAAGALRRWTRAESAQAILACWIAALFWALLPARAENVAWISGRGDVMGLALLLAGLALRSRLTHAIGRAAVIASATALALLCKESFVAAPIVVAVDLALEGDDPRGRGRLVKLLRSPEILASAATVITYLAFRRVLLPIHGGGEAMFAGLGIADRVALALESLGHALIATVICFEAHLLRGPIGFTAPFVLKREPGMMIAGALFVALLAGAAWRAPRLRAPVAILAGALLPVVNVIPSGLESRMSDRFLYLPSLGVALAMALLLAAAPARAFRAVALGLGAAVVALMLITARRSADFRSSLALWEQERARGDRAPTVLHNAAMAMLRARRYPEARDRLMETAARYGELGFDEGYPYLIEAAHTHHRATGEGDPESLARYRRLLEAILAGAPDRVKLPFAYRHAVAVPITTPTARQYAASRAREIGVRLALLDARAGLEGAAARSRAEVLACPRCRAVLREAARVELALASPDHAAKLLADLGPDEDAAHDALPVLADLQRTLLAGGDDLGRASALFLGEAYGPACRLGLGAMSDPRAAPPRARTMTALACRLAGDGAAVEKIRPALDASAVEEVDQLAWMYRVDPERRARVFRE